MKDTEQIIAQLRAETDAILGRDTSLSQRLAEVNERDVAALQTATPREGKPEKDNS